MTVVYIDSVFTLNALMDYLLLLVTARLAGIPLRRGRYLLAALAGGAYAAAVFAPGAGFLAQGAPKAAAGAVLALIAYGGEARLGRLTAVFFGLSCGLAGCVLALGTLLGRAVPAVNGVLYTDVDARVLLIAASGGYLVLTVGFRAAARHAVAGRRLPLRLCVEGRVLAMTALWDTGNGLREPGSGRPVLVLAPGTLDGALPPGVRSLLTPEGLRHPAELVEPLMAALPALRPRLLPYRAVGTAGGLLLAVRTEWAEIGGVRYQGLLAALAPEALGTDCCALWGGGMREEREYGGTSGLAAAGEAGTGGAHPLHRRQRRAAAAPEQGAGGGAPRPAGGRGGPPGADRAQPAPGGLHRPPV